jgi:hypothetical protein
MDRGKRLSPSNIIGRKGEHAFAQWALDHLLSANKADLDIGVDFFCQVLSPVAGTDSLEAAGPVLGAQVKTVEDADKPRLRLNRVDAENLLRQTQVTSLFGIHLSDQDVHFQFLTKNFADQLLDFLDGKTEEVLIPFASMSDDWTLFRRLLPKYANPFEQLQLRVHIIQRRVKRAIPGASLKINSTDADTVCQVYVPQPTAAFTVLESAREEVRLNVLRGGIDGILDPQLEGVAFHPAILNALKETQSSRLELGFSNPKRAKVGIRWQDQQVFEPFDIHTYGTEVAYVHRTGLRLTMNTEAEKTSEGYVHAMEAELFRPRTAESLKGGALSFLRLLKPGAILTLRPGWNLPLSAFGDSLQNIGSAIDAIPELCRSLGLPLSQIALADIKDEEFARTLWFLEALLLKGVPLGQMVNGFIVGPAGDLLPKEIPTVPISLHLPIVLNWKETGIVIWAECDGEGFIYEGLLCGIRVRQHRNWAIEKTDCYKKSMYPELWVAKDWPAIPIGSKDTNSRTWTFDPAATLPFEATIRKTRHGGWSKDNDDEPAEQHDESVEVRDREL